MNKTRAIQRTELTKYEQSIVDKIESRIAFLDFIKNGIKFYGFEKHKDEIKALKIEKSFDLEPLIRIPYNLEDDSNINNDLINSIIEICIDSYGNVSRKDVFSTKYRGEITHLRIIMFSLLHKYGKMSPTKIGNLFGRSRTIVHNGFTTLYQSLHLKKYRDVKFNKMFIEMNNNVCKKLKLRNSFKNIPNDCIIECKNNIKSKPNKIFSL